MILDQILHATANSLVLGSLIGLIAVGYSLVYGVAKLLNLAHGEIFVLGAYFAIFFTNETSVLTSINVGCLISGFSFFAVYSVQGRVGTKMSRLGVALVAAVVTFCIIWPALRLRTPMLLAIPLSCLSTVAAALFLEFVAYRPLAAGGRLNYLISAVGMSLALQSTMQILFGTGRTRFSDETRDSLFVLRGMVSSIGIDAYVSGLDCLIILTSVVTMVIITVLIRRTSLGLILRAVADDSVLSRSYGIDVTRCHIIAFGIGAVLACLASILFVARESALEPTFGYQQGILAFAAAVLGGIGRIDGAFVGGLTIGGVLSFVPLVPVDILARHLLGDAVSYLPSVNPSDWSYGIVYITMIGILVFKPEGLFGGLKQRAV